MRWGTMSAETSTSHRRSRGESRLASYSARRLAQAPVAGPDDPWDDGPARSADRPILTSVGLPAPEDGERFAIERLWSRTTKRVVDILVGVPLCVVFLIAYPIVAAILKLTSPGPVLFTQVRVGRGGHRIAVYKFRSMYSDAEVRLRADTTLYEQYLHNGFKVPSTLDPRITRFGQFLRRTSIDELPQALCVLQGTMSAVGPRPVVPEELIRLYGDSPRPYLACKPGLTGLWQVSGRSQVLFEHRARLDATYAAEWSLRGDLRILARTMPVVLSAHGAH
jgi:exopolysaccharide production protein ExoY